MWRREQVVNLCFSFLIYAFSASKKYAKVLHRIDEYKLFSNYFLEQMRYIRSI